jgi:hypothetical protein
MIPNFLKSLLDLEAFPFVLAKADGRISIKNLGIRSFEIAYKTIRFECEERYPPQYPSGCSRE